MKSRRKKGPLGVLQGSRRPRMVQGAWALPSALTSNPGVKRLDSGQRALWGRCRGLGTCPEQKQQHLRGAVGEPAGSSGQPGCVCHPHSEPGRQRVQLAGNGLEEQAAQYLAELLLAHTGLKSLGLSYKQLTDPAGETLGPALAENSGLTELNISWNHL
ncbi:hypothetical protein HPG69_016506 [Diceros bicornis minor]|uniref:Uncharacterized protein n=1 Tax=Diceros bicornis minor TaxID=77932 RepID=A0A7J7F4T3_DICBM|nr:hypothetical protein HPG69_016506 [Diceros bicornis minor]